MKLLKFEKWITEEYSSNEYEHKCLRNMVSLEEYKALEEEIETDIKRELEDIGESVEDYFDFKLDEKTKETANKQTAAVATAAAGVGVHRGIKSGKRKVARRVADAKFKGSADELIKRTKTSIFRTVDAEHPGQATKRAIARDLKAAGKKPDPGLGRGTRQGMKDAAKKAGKKAASKAKRSGLVSKTAVKYAIVSAALVAIASAMIRIHNKRKGIELESENDRPNQDRAERLKALDDKEKEKLDMLKVKIKKEKVKAKETYDNLPDDKKAKVDAKAEKLAS